MARLSHVDPATDSGAGADLLNGPLKSMQINIFKHMAVNPGMLKAFLGFNSGAKAGALTEKEHEVVALTCAQAAPCDYCISAHSQIAQGAGFSADEVLSIRRGDPADERHAALAAFVRRMRETNGHVDDADIAAFKAAGYDDAAIMEVIAEMTCMYLTGLVNHVAGTEIDFPAAAPV